MKTVQSAILNNILFVGPDYKNHRGGIGAVLESYHSFLHPFHFIPSYQPFRNNREKITYFFRQFGRINKALKNPAIQIVHIHGSHRASFYRKMAVFILAKGVYKKKVIYHVHSSSFDLFYKNSNALQKRLIQKLVNHTDLLVCLSPWWKHFFNTNFNCKKISIINNVVLPPVAFKRVPADASKKIQFLFLGRIGQRKGIFDLLDALEKSKAFLSGNIKLCIGGDGETELLQRLIREKGLEQLVEYVGWVSAEKKAALLEASDVYILPSYNEGLPISILEAMSYGMPIIATRIGGIPEVVTDRHNGFLMEPGAVSAIEKAIRYFVENRKAIELFGNRSLEIIEPFYPENVSAQLIRSYQSLSEKFQYESGLVVS